MKYFSAKRGKVSSPWFFPLRIFDLIHKTDTYSYILKDEYKDKPDNIEYGTFYMPSHIRDVKYAFRTVKKHLGESFGEYSFMDIGCGKGIVILIWRKLFPTGRIYGIDYYAPLIQIARENSQKIFGNGGYFYLEDAAKLRFDSFGWKFIIYLANPFRDPILRHILNGLKDYPAIIIYHNPVHADLMESYGYTPVHQKTNWFPARKTIIYEKK